MWWYMDLRGSENDERGLNRDEASMERDCRMPPIEVRLGKLWFLTNSPTTDWIVWE
jgi:hypothetical protein